MWNVADALIVYVDCKSFAQICARLQIIDAVIVASHHDDIACGRHFSFDFLLLWFNVVPSVLVTENVIKLFSICISNNRLNFCFDEKLTFV